MNALLVLLGVLLGVILATLALGARLNRMRARALLTESERDGERTQNLELIERHERELEGAREHHAQQLASVKEQVALVQSNREQLRDELKSISADVLKQTGDSLAQRLTDQRRAEEQRAASEMDKHAAEIKRVVAPITEHLQKVQAQVQTLERDRKETHGTVRQLFETVTQEVGKLRMETGTLVSALKRPQVRGSWGEIQLRNVARIAGMTDHVDFHDQRTLDAGDDGRLRPDMTVHLPTGRDVVVDSKVPLDAYLASLEARDDSERERELDRHATQLRTHLDKLAAKSYHAKLERSAEFVVCFIPNEACYVAALDRDPRLLEHGAQKGVLIATPTTLLALLHATHYGWRQAEVEQSALKIAAAGKELHKRCARFLTSFSKLGRQLDSATGAYNEAVGSLEARVLPQLRSFEQFQAGSDRKLEVPKALDASPRVMTAVELTATEEDGLPAPHPVTKLTSAAEIAIDDLRVSSSSER
ncbi:MAG TPA: DNA recombination protein RmuC [Solirubrobacteraceae bacterium]|jgi:DNA recombination protein RmuC